jgi:hypothetical protein
MAKPDPRELPVTMANGFAAAADAGDDMMCVYGMVWYYL